MQKHLLLAFILSLMHMSLFAQTWTGTTSNDWNTPSNWSTSTVPTAAGNVVVPTGICGTCLWPMLPAGTTDVGTIDVQGELHTNASSGTLRLNTNQGINRVRNTGVLGSAGQPGDFTTLGTITAQLNTDAGANVHLNLVAFRFGGETRLRESNFHGTFEGTDFGGFGTWCGLRANGCNFYGTVNFTANITTSPGSGNYTGFSGNTFHDDVVITHLSTQSNLDMAVTAGWFSGLPTKHETFLGNVTIVSDVSGANRSFSIDGGTVRSTVAGDFSLTIRNRSEARINNLEVAGSSEFIAENTTSNNGIRLARDNGGHSAVFNGPVSIRAMNVANGVAFRAARLGNVTFNGNITVENTGSTGNADIYIGEDQAQPGTVTLAPGVQYNATTYTSGRLLIMKNTQAVGATVPSHSLICSANAEVYMRANTLQGNLVVAGDRMDIRKNTFGTDASNTLSLSHIGDNGRDCGGNTFKSPVTFNKTSGNGWWAFGWNNGANEGGPDVMEHDVTINSNASWIAFAMSTTGTVFNDVSGNFTANLNGGRLFLGGWDTALGARDFRIKGNANFDLDYNGNDGKGTLRIASHTSAANMSGQIDGNTTFDITPSNGNNRPMVQVVQHNTHSVHFGGNVQITANSGGFSEGARIYFGHDGGNTTLAAGSNFTLNSNSETYIGNFTQTGTGATHSITLHGGIAAPPESSAVEGGRLDLRGITTFGGDLSIESTGVGGDWPPYHVLAAENAGEIFTVNGNLTLLHNGIGGTRDCCDGNRFVFAPGGIMNLTGNLDITLAAGADINFGENVNGWYGGSGGYLVLNGTADQTITSNAEVNFNNLRLDKTGGNVHFAGSTTQHRTESNLDFAASNTAEFYLNGIDYLIYNTNATPVPGTITGAGSTTGYVVAEGTGRLFQRVTGGNVNFPVGTATSYMPATLNNAGTGDQFGLRMEDLSAAPYGISEYFLTHGWDIEEENAGGSNLTVTGEWPSAAHMPNFNTALSGFYWWNGSYFECLEPEGPAGGSNPFTQDIASLGATNSVGVLAVATAFADAYTGTPNVMNTGSCGFVILDANVDPFTGPGQWTQISGPSAVTFADAGDPGTTASPLVTGTYVFRWTTSHGCTDATSDVTINFTLTSLTPVALCTWTGNSNNGDWNDCGNWAGSVPGLVSPGVYSNVVIPGGLTTMYPVLDADVIVGDYTMTAGAEIDLAGFTLESQGATSVAGSQISGNGGIFLKTGTSSDAWAGGNTFTTPITIRNSGAGATLSLAGTNGNLFEEAVTFDIANATANILPSAAGTTTFYRNVMAQSIAATDFEFSANVVFGEPAANQSEHTHFEQSLPAGQKVVFNNLTHSKTRFRGESTTFFGLIHLNGTLTLDEGTLAIADNSMFSVRNPSPAAVVHNNGVVSSNDHKTAFAGGTVLETGVFARYCTPGNTYLFPVTNSGMNTAPASEPSYRLQHWTHYLPLTLTLDAGSDPDEIRVRTDDAVRNGYAPSGYTMYRTTTATTQDEHVTVSWVVTHETPAANLLVDVTPQWTTDCPWAFYEQRNELSATPGCDQALSELSRRFYRERSFVIRNTGSNWECTQNHGAASANGADTWTRTTTGITKVSPGFFGVFGVASATADVNLTATSQTTDCRVIDLDASGTNPVNTADRALLSSPAGGEWVFISGPSPVVFVDATNPITQAVGANVDGNYTFEWRRYDATCGSSVSTPIHTASVTVAVTGTGAGTAGLTTTWTGAINSDWNNCGNWTDGVPSVTTNVTIPSTAPNWPVLPGDITINSIVMNAGSEIDLVNHTLTTTNDDGAAPTPTIDDAFRNRLQGATVHSTTGTTNFDLVNNNAAYIWARMIEVRNSEFTGDINLVINDDHNFIVECGGNTFRELARVSNNSRSEWRWGRTAAGGADVFEDDAYIEVTDNLVGTRLEYRERFWNGWNTNFPDVYTGPAHPDPVDYISTPYYVPKSGVSSYTGIKVGFPSYPRVDYLPTNDPDPAVNAANFAANEAAQLANLADEAQSEANIATARQNVYDAWLLSAEAHGSLDNNLTQVTNEQAKLMGSACGSDAAVVTANASLNTALANASAFQTGALTTARDNAWTAYQDNNLATSTPGMDNAAANAANSAANTAQWHREQIWTALVNLTTAVNNCIDAYNTSIGGVVGTTMASGYIRMADDSPNNLFLANTYVKTKTAGRVHFCYETGSEVRFGPTSVDNSLITEFFNSGSGGNDGAIFAGKRGLVVFNTPLRFVQQGGYADEAGAIRLYEQAPAQVFINSHLEIQQPNAGSVWLGQNGLGTTGAIDLDGDLIVGSHNGDLQFHNFTKNSTTPFSVISGTQGRVVAYMTNTFNGDAVFENNGLGHFIGYDQAGQTQTFNGNVRLRNGSAEDVIRVSGRGDVRFNGNVEVENTFDFGTINEQDQCAICFGGDHWDPAAIGETRLSSGQTITVGAGGYATGALEFHQFIQEGIGTPQTVVLTAPDAEIRTETGTIFHSSLTFSAPELNVRNSTFQPTAPDLTTFTHFICWENGVGGGNTFHEPTTFEFRGVMSATNYAQWILGSGTPDNFLDHVTAHSAGQGSRFFIAHEGANAFARNLTLINGNATGTDDIWVGPELYRNQIYLAHTPTAAVTVNGNLTVENRASTTGRAQIARDGSLEIMGNLSLSNVQGNIAFGAAHTYVTNPADVGTTTLHGDLTLQAGWVQGWLIFKGFTALSTAPVSITLPATVDNYLAFGTNSVFHSSSVYADAGRLFLHGTEFVGNTEFHKRADRDDYSLGGNLFNGNFSLTNYSTERVLLAEDTGDTFNGTASFIEQGTGRIRPAFQGINRFKGDILVESINDRDFQFSPDLGSTVSLGSVLIEGSTDQVLTDNISNPARYVSFRKLEMNQVSASNNFIPKNSDFEIREEAIFRRGKIQLGVHNLYIRNHLSASSVAAIATNLDDSYVYTNSTGTVRRQVDAAGASSVTVLFPVGNSTSYLAKGLRQSGAAAVSDEYHVRVLDGVNTTYDPANNPTGPTITHMFVNGVWVTTENTPGGTEAEAYLYWKPFDELPSFDRNLSSVVRYNKTTNMWRCTQSPGAPDGATAAPLFWRITGTASKVTDVGVFSVASIEADAVTPLTICGAGSVEMQAVPYLDLTLGIVTPFTGEWQFISSTDGSVPTISDLNDPNALVSGLNTGQTYVLRWQNLGLEGNCNPGPFIDVTIIVDPSLPIPGVVFRWTGNGNDNNWFNCRNWDRFSIPNATNDVEIWDVSSPLSLPASATSPAYNSTGTNTYPIIDVPGAECRNIHIHSNAATTVTTGGSLAVGQDVTNDQLLDIPGGILTAGRDLTNNQTFNNTGSVTIGRSLIHTNATPLVHTAGLIDMVGAQAGVMGGASDLTLYNLQINKSALASSITLNSKLTVTNQLQLNTGKMVSSAANRLELPIGSTCNDGNPGSFVDGPIRRYTGDGNGFVFPTGDGNVWARCALTDLASVGAADYFTAEYFNANWYPNGPPNMCASPAPVLDHVSYVEHWQIDRSGSTEAKVSLYWENATPAGSHINLFSNLYVGRYTGSCWENRGGTLSGTLATGFVTTPARQSNFSPWTFATDLAPDLQPLPVEFLSFTAEVQDQDDVLVQWETDNERGASHFDVQKSFDGETFETIGQVQAVGESQSANRYNFLDKEAGLGLIYYRLRQVDLDGSVNFSPVVAVVISSSREEGFQLQPNPLPSGNILTLRINVQKGMHTHVTLTDALGRVVLQREVSLRPGGNAYLLEDTQQLAPGVYLVRVEGLDQVQKLIVE